MRSTAAVVPAPKYKYSRTRKHDRILREASERLRKHHQFRGREHMFDIDERDGTLLLKGRVPSYYVKQLLQTALRGIEGVKRLENHVRVLYPR